MALVLGDNFSYGGSKPLDARLKYNTLADMKAVVDATMYEGCEAYCVETDKYYKFLSSNTVDEDTGKWREREDSAGHVIEDSEGTALTQRDTLQFGEGFLAEDDSIHEKTVISPNVMQSGDMDDVVTPLPSVQSRYHKYSTEEQIVGEWIDGKPLYEKVAEFSGTWGAVGTITTVDIDTDTTHQWKMVNGYDNGSGSAFPSVSVDANNKSIQNNKIFGLNSGKLAIKFLCADSYFVGKTFSGVAIIQYTKSE